MFTEKKLIDKSKIQTWLVTGASSGVGHETCKQLLERGYNIIAISRRVPDFEHNNALCLSCDVTKPETIDNVIKKGIERFRKIDVLCNNAGIVTSATVEDETLEHMKEVFEVNYFGTFNIINAILPHFRENKNGTIINNTSKSGISPRIYGAAYCSTKHALEGLTGVLYRECVRFCRVMAFELGYFPSSGIKPVQKISLSDIPEIYKNLKSIDLKFKNGYKNNLSNAIDLIIKQAERKTMPRYLILGYDGLLFAKSELNLFEKDFKYSSTVGKSAYSIIKNEHYLIVFSKYLKYKLLKNFVWGNVRKRYKRKSKDLHNQIRKCRRYMKAA